VKSPTVRLPLLAPRQTASSKVKLDALWYCNARALGGCFLCLKPNCFCLFVSLPVAQ
jgi:hypothetical protein